MEVDAKVDHNWPGPPLQEFPAGLKNLDNFSARWQGFLAAPEDGEYEIGVEVDDGARLWIDGKLVAEDWNNKLRATALRRWYCARGRRPPSRSNTSTAPASVSCA